MAIRSDGSCGLGANAVRQLGDDTDTGYHMVPTRIGTDSDWQAVAAGFGHSLALKRHGSLWAWDLNQFGQLGDGTTENRHQPTRVAGD